MNSNKVSKLNAAQNLQKHLMLLSLAYLAILSTLHLSSQVYNMETIFTSQQLISKHTIVCILRKFFQLSRTRVHGF